MMETSSQAPIIDALLLGGGHGRRAGGPKALRLWEGELAWRWQSRQMRAWGCRTVAAVLHPDAWAEGEPPPLPEGEVLALRSDPNATMFASIQQGLRALKRPDREPADWILLLPVDCPWPGDEVANLLREEARHVRERAELIGVVRPQVEGTAKHGHPLLILRQASRELEWMDASFARLDRWIKGLGDERVISVTVQTRAVLANMNR